MNLSLMLAELRRDEGVRLMPYRDTVGKLTIGVGRNLTDVGITNAEAEALLATDVARTAADLDRLMPWWAELDEVRQRVLLNMAFNMGAAEVARWRNWHALLRSGQFAAAADAMMRTLWARQVGPRAVRLSQMMRDGTPKVA
jgi:lysozyme